MVCLLRITAAHPDDVLDHGLGVPIYLQLKAMAALTLLPLKKAN